MPNYKVFQDYPDSMRVKIYGADSANVTHSLLSNASGRLEVAGAVGVSGKVAISGPVRVSGKVAISGPVRVSGKVAVSGSVRVSGKVAISGPVRVSGKVAISGPVRVSGKVAVSGSVRISGKVAVSGPIYGTTASGAIKPILIDISGKMDVVNQSGKPLYVQSRVLLSGPISLHVSGAGAGVLGGIWPVRGYDGPSFVVKYSGFSGKKMSISIEDSPNSTSGNFNNYDGTYNFSGKTWNVLSPTFKLQYSRIFYRFSGSNSGNLFLWYQTERS